MPGSVSDTYDPEFGTGSAAAEIVDALRGVYGRVSGVLGNRPPVYVLDLVRADLPSPVAATLTEREWRIIRFALERAAESI